MKKLKLILALTLISFIGNAQNSTFKFNPDSTADFVVYNVDKQKASELYVKTLNWINIIFKNPEAVIKAKVENEMIRIEAFNKKVFTRTFKSGSTGDYDALYTLEIQFQDDKYRIKYTNDEIRVDGMKVYFTFSDMLNNVPDKNGNTFDNCKTQYEANVQELINSLYQYITKPKEKW